MNRDSTCNPSHQSSLSTGLVLVMLPHILLARENGNCGALSTTTPMGFRRFHHTNETTKHRYRLRATPTESAPPERWCVTDYLGRERCDMQIESNSSTPTESLPFEKHYRVGDLARMWQLGRETVRLLVKDDPAVIKIRMGRKKAHTVYSVPESAARRIHTRLLNPIS